MEGDIRMRELRKISAKRIRNLPAATAITRGGEVVGFLIPLRKASPALIAEARHVLEAEAAARSTEDEALIAQALRDHGIEQEAGCGRTEVDPTSCADALGPLQQRLDPSGTGALDPVPFQEERPPLAHEVVGDVLTLAIKALGSPEAAWRWLARPALALNRIRPIELCATSGGVERVRDLLGRLIYGVYT